MNTILKYIKNTLFFLIGGRAVRFRLLSDSTEMTSSEEHQLLGEFLLVIGIIAVITGLFMLVKATITISILAITLGIIAVVVGLALSYDIKRHEQQ